MMGGGDSSVSPLRWLWPFPYKNKHDLTSLMSGSDRKIDKELIWMRFDKENLRDLTKLEYAIEWKTEEDLIQSGFRLKRRIELPKHLKEITGEIDPHYY